MLWCSNFKIELHPCPWKCLKEVYGRVPTSKLGLNSDIKRRRSSSNVRLSSISPAKKKYIINGPYYTVFQLNNNQRRQDHHHHLGNEIPCAVISCCYINLLSARKSNQSSAVACSRATCEQNILAIFLIIQCEKWMYSLPRTEVSQAPCLMSRQASDRRCTNE